MMYMFDSNPVHHAPNSYHSPSTTANRSQRRDALNQYMSALAQNRLLVRKLSWKRNASDQPSTYANMAMRIAPNNTFGKQAACRPVPAQCMWQALAWSSQVRYNSPTSKFQWRPGRGRSWCNHNARRSRCMWSFQQFQCRWRLPL